MKTKKPSWAKDNEVLICTAGTCGLTKGGRLLPKIDLATGKRLQTKDEETGAMVDTVDDQLLEDIQALQKGEMTDTLSFVPLSQVSLRAAVPIYYDRRYIRAFQEALENGPLKGFSPVPLGQLIEAGQITLRHGHGSPSHEQRVGNVPYLKVSDLRAGLVNINPTNRIPRSVAKKFWGGPASGLQAFDIVCPERTSKNIGDFCVLLPGQEQVVMTNEVIVLRPGPNAVFDSFYILWAMTLKVVRDQWKRVIFMQTNREDVGNRFLEIVLPVPKSDKQAAAVSRPFREYYTTLAAARTKLDDYLKTANHHFYLNGNQHNEP